MAAKGKAKFRVGQDEEAEKMGLTMKYFVLKPSGDDRYAAASRAAMRRYAQLIEPENEDLARELKEWADKEWVAAIERGAFDEKESQDG